MENKYTQEDLKIMQSWPLSRKIQVTQTRILEWYQKFDGKVYVSFSGGKDSTVLAWLAAKVCEQFGYTLVLWFSDTGLEFPEIREHVKTFASWLESNFDVDVDVIIDYPTVWDGKCWKRVVFSDVIKKYGYPIISKEVSCNVSCARNKPNGKTAQKFIRGSDYHKKYGDTWLLEKYAYLIDAPFKISSKCCDVMKKKPAKVFESVTGLKPIIGTMACESLNRKKEWLRDGCNAFDRKRPQSTPISFWTEQDVLYCIVLYKIPYASIYGSIKKDEWDLYYTTGRDRTGCMFCGYGCHLEKSPNRFQKMKKTHPKIWDYCMKPIECGGLGMADVLHYIGIEIE